MAGRSARAAAGRDRGRAGRSSVVLREGAQGELDVVVGDPVRAQAAVRAVPGRDPVEGGQDEGGGNGGISRAKGSDSDAVADRLAEPLLVRVAASGDDGPPA